MEYFCDQVQNSTGSTGSQQQAKFHSFPKLPTEIRLMIWRHSLQGQRVIRIHLEGFPTRWTVDGHQVLSKLFRVNREARWAALRFYRVHLACHLKQAGRNDGLEDVPKPITVHMNPEYDILSISWESCRYANEALVDFIYLLKVKHDPLHIGLVNLAVECHSLLGIFCRTCSAHTLDVQYGGGLSWLHKDDVLETLSKSSIITDRQKREIFIETFSQLREIMFVVQIEDSRRDMFDGMPDENWAHSAGHRVRLNPTWPAAPMNPAIQLSQSQVQDVTEGLRQIAIAGLSPKSMFKIWKQMLKKSGIAVPHAKYQHLLISNPELKRPWLSDQENSAHATKPDGETVQTEPESPRVSPRIDGKGTIEPTSIFCFLPFETARRLHHKSHDNGTHRSPLDLSRRWPQFWGPIATDGRNL
ncbi:hypothetical protein BT63DRAFT_477992 [Microthyrium microscopicum]|uniref:2EXR domain-containing protein n=1 Tax=Microthyrium microscopicum TaxID=703497 RepID=A0A6A6UH58_9PEZI|nr:hypothetical protein BT63DRAFT_477992 [Microthyrium microscopicum]